MGEDPGVRLGAYGQPGALAAQPDRAVDQLELELSRLQDLPILVREHGQEHLVP